MELDEKTKELVALGTSITARCQPNLQPMLFNHQLSGAKNRRSEHL